MYKYVYHLLIYDRLLVFLQFYRPNRWRNYLGAQKLSFVQYLEIKLVSRKQLLGILLSMYSYCSSMYSYCCLCILIVVYVFLDSATLTEVFPCFFLGCKANARVQLAKTGHGPHSSKIVLLFYVLFVLYRSMYCLCLNVYCTSATG
jgi:hypothetical protein